MAAPISKPVPIGQRVIGIGSPPAHLLTAMTAPGDGTVTLDNEVCRTKWALQVIVTDTGTPTVVVDLYLSIDGQNWMHALAWNSASHSSGDIVSIVDSPAIAAYCKLTTLSGGTAPSVDAWVCAQ